MRKILILTCGILMMSSVAMAEGETTVETCAGGGGTLVTGKSGYKYCKSNKAMNWWNAVAWCDAMGKRLIDLNTDCGCNGTVKCEEYCPEIGNTSTEGICAWTTRADNAETITGVWLNNYNGSFNRWIRREFVGNIYALCK